MRAQHLIRTQTTKGAISILQLLLVSCRAKLVRLSKYSGGQGYWSGFLRLVSFALLHYWMVVYPERSWVAVHSLPFLDTLLLQALGLVWLAGYSRDENDLEQSPPACLPLK